MAYSSVEEGSLSFKISVFSFLIERSKQPPSVSVGFLQEAEEYSRINLVGFGLYHAFDSVFELLVGAFLIFFPNSEFEAISNASLPTLASCKSLTFQPR